MSPQDRQEEKPEGFSKYLKRMKTVLRPRSASKRQSFVVAPELVAPAETSAPTPTPAPVLVPAPTTAQEPIAPPPVVMTDYSTTPNEMTRKLFAKYGLTLDQGANQSPTDLKLARVTKPIRMRVRRICHRCETTFGGDKVCINCSHTRCTKCPRSPPDRPNDKPQVRKPKLAEISANHPRTLPVTPHIKYTGNAASPLAMTSRTGGQDLVKKTVRQRTHRKCHLCTTQFVSGSKKCECCSHVRCKVCPRDPAHLDRYPEGYPGDVDPPKVAPDRTFKKTRQRVHYLCHICETSYLQEADTCSKCGQAKCAETIRIPPKTIKREPNPDVVRSVEERLAAMAITATPEAMEAGL